MNSRVMLRRAALALTPFGRRSATSGISCSSSSSWPEASWASWTADQLRQYLDVAFEAFGPARILFGSDVPVCRLAASYAQVKRVIDDYCARLSDAERARVLADNAIAFYRLPVDPADHRPDRQVR